MRENRRVETLCCLQPPSSKTISGEDYSENMFWCERAFVQFVLIFFLIHIFEHFICFVLSNGFTVLFAQENPYQPLNCFIELKA